MKKAYSRSALAVSVVIILGCGGDGGGGRVGPTPVGTPSRIEVVSGANQSASVGATLPQPLVVRVLDAGGRGVASQTVTWTVGSGGGTLSASQSVTDADGLARSEWSLDLESGAYTVTVAVAAAAVPPATIQATAVPDTDAPRLTAFSISPSSVDVTDADAKVKITYRITDVGSGSLPTTFIAFKKSTGGRDALVCPVSNPPVSGTPLDGTFACDYVIPRSSLPGTWSIDGVVVSDRARNLRQYLAPELTAAGYSTNFTVVSRTPDLAAPVIKELSFTPSSVTVTSAAATVVFTARVSDVGTGVKEVRLQLQSRGFGPSLGSQGAACQNQQMSRTSGNAADGIWQCLVTIPKASAAGPWKVVAISTKDMVNNEAVLFEPTLRGAGFPTAINVTSDNEDIVAPVLTAFSITPATADVRGGPQTVTFTASISDAGTGVAISVMSLLPPAPTLFSGCGFVLRSGTANEGSYSCTFTVLPTSNPGEWPIEITLRDVIGNGRTYTVAELKAAGFPSSLTVIR